jgi:uncharacterized RDD family membrane protein YckC
MRDLAAIAELQDRRVRRRFVTPEGVDLSLRLADPGQRFSAFLLDGLIMFGVLVAITILLLLGAWAAATEAAAQIGSTIWLLGFFLLRSGYFIIMEMGPRGATFGKRAAGIRVVSRSGGRLTADAVIARNLMREIEFYLPLSFIGSGLADGSVDGTIALLGFGWSGIFLFFPFFNKDRLRVGDLLAGTWVIVTPRRKLVGDLLGDPEARAPEAGRFTEEQLGVYGAFELQTLERVLRTGNMEALSTVAYTIREKIGYVQNENDREFLTAYYEAVRARLERGMLFGRRRRDKHDR